MKKEKTILQYIMEYFGVVAWTIPFSWKSSRLYTIIRICGAMFLPIISIILTFAGKYTMDALTSVNEASNSKGVLVCLFMIVLGITLLKKALQSIIQYSQSMHNELIHTRVSMLIMEKSLVADLEYFDNPSFNDKLVSASQDSFAVANILWNVISTISSIVSFLSVLLVMCQSNWFYGIIVVASAFPASIATAKYTRYIYELSLQQMNGQRQIGYTQAIATDKHYAQEIRLFNIGSWLKDRYRLIWHKMFVERQNMNRKQCYVSGLLECFPEIVIALISIDVAFKIVDGKATIGDYALYTGLIAQLWNAVYTLSSSAVEIYGNRLRIENIKSLNQYRNRIEDNGSYNLNRIKEIEFEDIHFTYPLSSQPTLNGVSFKITENENIALVGLNGSGKSTLIKLLLRMYNPDSGRILINGVDIKAYKIAELRKNFSVYFQEMLNYGFTIRENFSITDFNQEAIDETMDLALKRAHFKDLGTKSPKGYDANIMKLFDAEGIELSGGQFQKLALARAFYRTHSVLVLDEPSSNLDPIAEKNIFESVQELSKGKITIFTSHRLSNIFLADRIIVIENGEVTEDGTHNELLKKNARYAQMFRTKQKKYEILH